MNCESLSSIITEAKVSDETHKAKIKKIRKNLTCSSILATTLITITVI